MTLSYRCDGYNDCGCDEDCDEYGCEGLGLGKSRPGARLMNLLSFYHYDLRL